MIPFLGILLFFYTSYVIFNIIATRRIRKKCKEGDFCNVYIGEHKLTGFIMKVNDEVDVWVANKIIRFTRDQLYA